jgi:hypothetical protein
MRCCEHKLLCHRVLEVAKDDSLLLGDACAMISVQVGT